MLVIFRNMEVGFVLFLVEVSRGGGKGKDIGQAGHLFDTHAVVLISSFMWKRGREGRKPRI